MSDEGPHAEGVAPATPTAFDWLAGLDPTDWEPRRDPRAILADLAAERDQARAEVERLRGLVRHAWDEGHRTGWEHHQDGNYGTDYWDDDTPNPYRDLRAATADLVDRVAQAIDPDPWADDFCVTWHEGETRNRDEIVEEYRERIRGIARRAIAALGMTAEEATA